MFQVRRRVKLEGAVLEEYIKKKQEKGETKSETAG